MRLEQRHLLRLAEVDHVLSFVGGRGQGLLAQDVLAALGGFLGPLGVQGVGERVVDDVDFGVVEEFFIAAVGFGDAGCFGRGLSLGERAAGDAVKLDVGGFLERRQEPVVDLGDAENAPAGFLFGHWPLVISI